MFTETFNKMDIFAPGLKNLDIFEEFFHHKYFDYFYQTEVQILQSSCKLHTCVLFPTALHF